MGMRMAARAGAAAGTVGWRAILVLAIATGVGCGGDDGASDEGAAESGAGDGPDDGTASSADGDPPAADVPDSDYCAGVADWPEQSRTFEAEVVVLVNQARAQGGNCGGQPFGATGPLTMEGRLRCAARVHSLDMVERGFFDHQNPDGESPFDRMEQAGYAFSFAGENIAAGQPTPQEVVDGWLDSPGHCANILSPDFTEIGVGYVSAPQGALPHYWTQVFGTPL